MSFVSKFIEGFTPEPLYTVSQWADANRFLAQAASSEPGRWRTDRTPYLREIMDCLSVSSPVERVVFMKGAQIGGTEAGNNWLGYIIDRAPGPLLVVQPTVEMAKRWSRGRLDPLIASTPKVREKVMPTSNRNRTGNAVQNKDFPGGLAIIAGANSPAGLRSMPVRYLFLDEVDAYPLDCNGEGDPISLAIQRTATFAKRKIFIVSTPTIQGISRVEKEYEQSDQRTYHVPCPHCGEFQMLIWTQIVSEDGKLPHYKCLHCDRKIYEHHKTTMLKNGKWVAKYPDRPIAGFHLSSLYSPVGWFSWKQAMINYEQAKGNDALLKVWVNTTLGESWQDKGETPAWEHLYERAEDYPIGKIPEGGLVLTAGVDVQKDRLECEVVAWGPHRESWSVDYIVIPHAPSQQESWQQLETILHKNYPFVSDDSKGQQIMMMAIDSGYAAQEVYNWVRSQNSLRVMATKGSPHPRVPLGSPTKVEVNIGGRKLKRGLKLWCIGVNLLKSELYSWLKQTRVSEKVPPGYAHFPKYGPEYFMQLTAEQLVTKVVNGYPKQEWQKLRDRNEVLDCRVYARAASIALGIDRWEARHWKNFSNQKQVNIAAVEAPVIYQNPVDFIKTPTNTPTPEPVVANKANRPRPRVIRSKWMS